MDIGHSDNGDDYSVDERFRHLLTVGTIGTGKTTLQTHLLKQRILQGKGCAVIDPVGDQAEDLMTWASSDVSPFCKRNFHYLEPGVEKTFKYDPAATHLTGKIYDAWLAAKIESMIRVFARKEGVPDLREMPRRERGMTNVLYAAMTRQRDGSHYGIHRVLELLEVGTRKWDQMFSHLFPVLPNYVAADWELMKRMSRAQFLQFTESTVNWFRTFLSPVVRAIFSGDVPTIDFRKIIAENGVLICNLRPNSLFSRDQSNAIAGLLIREIIEAAERNHYGI